MSRISFWQLVAVCFLVAPPALGDAPNVGEHWAFLTPTKREPPAVANETWVQNDVDRFVLERLEREGLTPSPAADKRTLARRLYYDLIGLPPTYEQVEQFVNDDSPGAYDALVDALLESPHFGERWARYWLDVSRFGDTKGYVFTESRDYPNAFKYRDWVINAIQSDMPIDRFLMLQLAADQLVEADDAPELAALGYLTLGRRFINNKHDIIDDRIDVVFRGMMGLTVSCARCHDHKYDPIASRDYYAVYGVFASSPEHQADGMPLRLKEAEKPIDAHVFNRGNPGDQGDVAPRRFLSHFDPSGEPFSQGSGRKELAEAIVDPANPLTARVFVNRVWDHLLGAPLVATPSDFGVRTDPPVEQPLLDHLAATFVADDAWSLKRLIRRIVGSSVYQQSSAFRSDANAVDPANDLWWRANRKRLDFEAMRDSLLAVSGQLNGAVGGPSERIETWPPTTRRTLYAFIDRQNLPSIFRTFDFASPDTHSPKRPNTVVPQQALFLFNSPFAHFAAEHVMQRVDVVGDDGDTAERIRELYRVAFARNPDADELKLGEEFVTHAKSEPNSAPSPSPWRFGYGYLEGEREVRFEPLPHFTGDAWQGGTELPNPNIGWVFLKADGGHPGDNQEHAAIRRWVAPQRGTVTIHGTLDHPSDKGDGVRARIVSGERGVAGEWTATHQKVATKCESFPVEAGEAIDFITDCRDNPSYDSFQWKARLRFTPPSGVAENVQDDESAMVFQTVDGFHGPQPTPLSPWARYAHALLMTNEFMFLD